MRQPELMTTRPRACVFCGSAEGNEDSFTDAARSTGRTLAEAGFGVVFGGGRVGMMGHLANGALEAGGEVLGVIPRALMQSEIAHDGVTEMFVVNTMHERKAMMAHLSSAFVVLPGGFGTLEETMEVVTWLQLGFHDKPVALLDVNGFFDGLFEFFLHAEQAGFIRPQHRGLIQRYADPQSLVRSIQTTLPAPRA